MERRVCEGCGKEYWPNQGWLHEKCLGRTDRVGLPDRAISAETGGICNAAATRSSLSTWTTREEYKAYRREYMRAYRAKRK